MKLFLIALILIAIPISVIEAKPSAVFSQHRGYIDTSGIYHVIGEIKNTGNESLALIVSARFYDEKGSLITREEALTSIRILLPNKTAPFDIASLAANIKDYRLDATAEVVKGKPELLHIPSSISYTDSLGFYHVTGNVTNKSKGYATYTNVVATFYDEKGRIVAIGRDITEPINIPSNNYGSFKITVDRGVSDIASYSLDAESDELLMSK